MGFSVQNPLISFLNMTLAVSLLQYFEFCGTRARIESAAASSLVLGFRVEASYF